MTDYINEYKHHIVFNSNTGEMSFDGYRISLYTLMTVNQRLEPFVEHRKLWIEGKSNTPPFVPLLNRYFSLKGFTATISNGHSSTVISLRPTWKGKTISLSAKELQDLSCEAALYILQKQ